MEINLNNRVALVTGATGQLGRVMVRTLSRCGAAVAIHTRSNPAVAAELLQELTSNGASGCIVQGDVGDLDQMTAMGERIRSVLGAPDIVVTNAVSQIFPWRTVLEEDPADYADQFRTCVLQNVHAAKVFVPAMVEKKWGRFIGINTECTIQTLETQSAYVSGKKGMDGVLRVLAREVGPAGVTVNQVAPGWTISFRDRENGTEDQPDYTKHVPLRRRGTDQDVANAVAFLASDLAGFITGAFLPVNGGNTIPC